MEIYLNHLCAAADASRLHSEFEDCKYWFCLDEDDVVLDFEIDRAPESVVLGCETDVCPEIASLTTLRPGSSACYPVLVFGTLGFLLWFACAASIRNLHRDFWGTR